MSTPTDCLFCKIVAGTIPAKRLFEDDHTLAFADIGPQAPTHLLFIPRTHYARAAEAPPALLGTLLANATTFAELHLPNGYRIVINSGDEGGQTVHHLHLHLLGGRPMTWPPG